MITRLARWWLARGERRPVDHGPALECTVCAGVADRAHTIVSLGDDDRELGIEGSTAMSADYCAEHCPGGCRSGCPTLVG